MKNHIPPILAVCCSATALLSLAPERGEACGSDNANINSLPPFDQTSYQVYALGSKGAITGFSVTTGVHGPEAFIVNGGAKIDLGTLGGPSSFGYSINSKGEVTGESDLNAFGNSHAFRFSEGTTTDLGTLGGPSSAGVLINEAGQVAGWSLPASGTETVAFLWSNGSLAGLGTLSGDYSYPYGLNNKGQVTGESSLANGDIHGFLSSGTSLTDLGTLGGDYSSAFAVNDEGIAVGESSLPNGDTHAFAWVSGTMVDLGTVGGTYSSAFLVNSNNEIAGNGTAADGQMHGFFFANGTLTDLGTLGGSHCSVWAMNNCGQMVGDSSQADGTSHAFLWAKGKLTDLNNLLPANSGWELTAAQFINDAGRIVGVGISNGVSQWFVLDLPQGGSPPVAIAGPDQVVECQTAVQLDGSASHGAANEPLSFEWSLAGNVLGTDPVLSISLPPGTNVVTLKVTDPCGACAQTNTTVTVLDTTAPAILSHPARIKVPTGNDCEGVVPDVRSEVVAMDSCAPREQLVLTQQPAAGATLPRGHHHIVVTATDPAGNTATCTIPFVVCDMIPPTIQSLEASPNTLSTPNHKLVAVKVSVDASDNCSSALRSRIVRVTCNESMDRDDVRILDDLTVMLGATRNPSGPGRIYTIHVRCADGAGNCTTGTVQVSVPKPNDVPSSGGDSTRRHR